MIPQGPYSLYTFDLELIIFTSLFVFKLPRRKLFALRVLGCLGLIALFTGFWGWIPQSNMWLSALYFILIFLMVTLSCFLCFKMPALSSLYCVTTAYASQHITYKIIQMFLYLIEIAVPVFKQNVWGLRLTYAAIFLVFVTAYYLFFSHRIKPQDALAFNSAIMLFISLFLIACAIALNLVIESMVPATGLPDTTFYIAGLYDVICCVFALLLQFGKFKEKKLSSEYFSMKKLWKAEKKQLEISKENMDYMRILAHDLRHEMLANRNGPTKRGQELDKRLSSFGNTYKTANEILDLVLAERRLRLEKNGITLTCMADGQALNFMDPSDTYSLFTNLIDNALEALLLIAKNRRIFTLTIRQSKGLVFIHEENPYEGKIVFAQGLPLTTKKDGLDHGLGTKSMRIIAQKYGGELMTRTDNGVFIVDLVLVPHAEK